MTVPGGIRLRLLALAAICMVPVFGLVVAEQWSAARSQVDSAREALAAQASAAAADLDRSVRTARLLLQSMAQIPAIVQLERDACSTQLERLAAPYQEVGNAFGIGVDGVLRCSASTNQSSVDLSDRDYFKRALGANGPVTGDTIVSRTDARRFVLPLAAAVRDPAGQIMSVLAVGVNLTAFGESQSTAWTGNGTAITLWSKAGAVAFRWPKPEQWWGNVEVGAPDLPDTVARSTGSFEAVGIDDVARVYGFATSALTGMKVTLSVPRNELIEPQLAALARGVGFTALLGLGGFALAWLFGEAVVRRPLTALADVARRLSAGDLSARWGRAYPGGETGSLARAFDTMGDALARQIRDLRDSEDRLRMELERTATAERRVRQQLEHMHLLDQITRSIGERLDLRSIFQVVVRSLEGNLPVDFCCLALHEPDANRLRVECVGVKGKRLTSGLSIDDDGVIPIDANGLSRCMGGELVNEPDVAQIAFPFPQRLAAGGLRSMVLAPLKSESRVFGVLVAARVQASSFTSVECEFLRQLSEHVALAAGQARLHEALQQAYDDLRQTQQVVMQEERLRALGQMASGIAHDINNALSPVSLYTESLLESESGLTERARRYLVTIQRAVADVAETVARMREFYRQREDQVDLRPVDLNLLAGQVLELTRARWCDMAQQQGIAIDAHCELEPDLPLVPGVAGEIRDALTNLVFNAVDALPRGGRIIVRTRRVQPDVGAPRAVAVEVTDDGIGMDEATRRRCLEPFFTTKGERGTGLGLAMVFGAASRHDADVAVESSPGAGTTVRISFPVKPLAGDAADAADADRKRPMRLHLLLIDDDPVLLKSLCDALEGDGHTIVTANGGEEGIAAFARAMDAARPISAVITDLGMPHVDGRRVAAAIKERSSATPVLLLTGWGQRLVASGEVPPNVDRVLAKPPRLRDLREALADLCGRASS